MIELRVDESNIERLAADLYAVGPVAEKALSSTISKMASWLRTRTARGLSDELSIQQKIIRRRLKSTRVSRTADGASIKLWYGLNPISLIHLGARQNKSGVRAQGGRFVAGAFIRNGRSGRPQVFKRRGAARLPIDKQQAEIRDAATGYLDKMALRKDFERQFFAVFQRELQWRTR